jgi:hypothetical protein
VSGNYGIFSLLTGGTYSRVAILLAKVSLLLSHPLENYIPNEFVVSILYLMISLVFSFTYYVYLIFPLFYYFLNKEIFILDMILILPRSHLFLRKYSKCWPTYQKILHFTIDT